MRFEARAWTWGVLVVALLGVTVAGVYAQKDPRREPLPAYYFQVEIGGVVYQFRSCSGLRIETDVIEFQEGTGDVIRKLAGPTRYPNLRLTRAFTGDRALYDWYVNTRKPLPAKVDGRIMMFDRQGSMLAVWTFKSGFPAKWEGPDLDATKNEIAVETIEIAHEGLTLADGPN